MITPQDLISLPYTPDMTQAGVLHACRSLALGLVQADNLHTNPLRKLIASVAAELALRRRLAEENITFKTSQITPFTHAGWGEIFVGGRRCHLVDILIARSMTLRRLGDQRSYLLGAPACVPDAHLYSERLEPHDLLVFAFVLAKPQPGWRELRQVPDEIPPCYFAYILPKAWKNPAPGRMYAQLSLTNEGQSELAVELGGRGATGQFQSEAHHLPPRQSVKIAGQYTSLAFLSTQRIPPGQLSLTRAGPDRALRIPANGWANLWLDGIEIILAGYMTVGDFRSAALRHLSHDRLWDDLPLVTPTLSLPVSELHPLPQLFTWIKSIF